MGSDFRKITIALILLFSLSCIITLVQTQYVGDLLIYSDEHVENREMLHRFILANELPEGESWRDLGANGTKIRVGVVYLAEFVSKLLGISVAATYKYIDVISMVLSITLLFLILAKFVRVEEAIIGVLFIAAILPMTYHFHYFHPWDRISLALWLVMFLAIFANRPLLLAAVMILAIVVKYDAVVIPLMYFLVHVRRDNYEKVFLVSFILSVLSFGEYFLLRELFEGGSSGDGSILLQIKTNLYHLLEHDIYHPAVLGLTLPAVLAIYGFRSSERSIQGATLFGLILLLPHMTLVNFREIRAEMPALVALLPGALIGLRLALSAAGQGLYSSGRGSCSGKAGQSPDREI